MAKWHCSWPSQLSKIQLRRSSYNTKQNLWNRKTGRVATVSWLPLCHEKYRKNFQSRSFLCELAPSTIHSKTIQFRIKTNCGGPSSSCSTDMQLAQFPLISSAGLQKIIIILIAFQSSLRLMRLRCPQDAADEGIKLVQWWWSLLLAGFNPNWRDLFGPLIATPGEVLD
jgi:hypothetical protein